ncbi:MAG: ABC transporter substrate-binding protein [Bdellovibrionales bacterium]
MTQASTAAPGAPLKLGFVPMTFPRDTTAVNQFAEHAILGQILEPLVDADRFGNMTPGLAKSWNVSKDGRTFTFDLFTDREFSNGKAITSKDVLYSLKRHLNGSSQSRNFLTSIKSIAADGPGRIIIKLKEPNVAILKTLTRDHLGIVPEGWTFDPKSDEPIIGSGAYRLVRKNGKWLLVLNEKFPNKEKVSVPEWELVFFTSEGSGVPGAPLPDYAPLITEQGRNDLEAEFKKKGFPVEIKEQLSFVQTSLWWYPHGARYRSADDKARIMGFLSDLVEVRCGQTKCQRATGIVPVGIAGFLPEPLKIPSKPAASGKKLKVRIAGMGILFNFLFEGKTASEIAAKYNVEFDFFTFTPATLNELAVKKPDVVMGSWAGGFNDPEGFLPLLNQLLAADFMTYLEDLAPLYQKARTELNWTKRAELFREFNERLVREQRMIPGWKIPMYSALRPNLKEEEIGFRYTPRLINVKKVQ